MGVADKRDSAEAQGGQQSQPKVWKTQPVTEEDLYPDYFGDYGGEEAAAAAGYVKDLTTGLWMVPESDPFQVPYVTKEDFKKGPRAGKYNPSTGEIKRGRKEEWADFYSSDDYVKDTTSNRMMAPITENACKKRKGFVCKVKLYNFKE